MATIKSGKYAFKKSKTELTIKDALYIQESLIMLRNQNHFKIITSFADRGSERFPLEQTINLAGTCEGGSSPPITFKK